MTTAIRDVTIRVKIEQIESQLRPPNFEPLKAAYADLGQQAAAAMIAPQTFADQAAGHESIAQAVQQVVAEKERQAASAARVTSASRENFDAMLAEAEAENRLEAATRSTTTAQRAQSIENIQGTGNSLRAAAASGTLEGVVASLGQALIFSAKGAAEQSVGNTAVASSATRATSASGYQAVAVGAVGAAGARAATANAALAASNKAVEQSAQSATSILGRLGSSLPMVVGGVAALNLAVVFGRQAWEWWKESARTANDDVRDAVKQRLEAEQQSAKIEAALAEEQNRRRGTAIVAIERQREALERYRTVQEQIAAIREESFAQQMGRNEGDLGAQLQMLESRRLTIEEGRLRASGMGDFYRNRIDNGEGRISADQAMRAAESARRFDTSLLGGTDLLRAEQERNNALEASQTFLERTLQIEQQREAVLKRSLQAELQHRDALRDQLSSVQERISAEQGRLQSAAERFAQMDPGEQARLRQISEKARSGRDLSIQEAQLLRQSGVGDQFASRTFEREAERAGFGQIAGNLGEFQQIEQLQFQSKGLADSIANADREIAKRADEIREAVASVDKILSAVASVGEAWIEASERIDKLEQTFADKGLKSRPTSGPPVGSYGRSRSGS